MTASRAEVRRMAIGFHKVASDSQKRAFVAGGIQEALKQLSLASSSLSNVARGKNGTEVEIGTSSKPFKKPHQSEPISKELPDESGESKNKGSELVDCLLDALVIALSEGKLPETSAIATPKPVIFSDELVPVDEFDDEVPDTVIPSEEPSDLITIQIACPNCKNFMSLEDDCCPHCGEDIQANQDSSFEINYMELSNALCSEPLNAETLVLVTRTVDAILEMNRDDKQSASLVARFASVALVKGAEMAPEMDQVLAMEIAIDAIAEIGAVCSGIPSLSSMISREHLDFWAEAALAVLYQAESAGQKEWSIFYFLLGTNSIDFKTVMKLRDDAPSEEIRAMAEEIEAFEREAEMLIRPNWVNIYGLGADTSAPAVDVFPDDGPIKQFSPTAPEPIGSGPECVEKSLGDTTHSMIVGAVLSFLNKN